MPNYDLNSKQRIDIGFTASAAEQVTHFRESLKRYGLCHLRFRCIEQEPGCLLAQDAPSALQLADSVAGNSVSRKDRG